MASSSSKSSAFINFEIVGNDRGVQGMLSNLDSCLSPIGLSKFLLGAVGPMVAERAADRFAAEGDDVTGRWAPLAATTVEIREKQGFTGSHPINKRTGELEEYITNGQFSVTSVPGVSTLKFPGDPPKTKALKEKLKTAQQGRKSPRTQARPVLGLNERDLAQVMTALAFYVQAGGVVK